jgi:hypothetical protein
MKKVIVFGILAVWIANVLHAQNAVALAQTTEVESFIKKYEEQGNYVEVSAAYLKDMRESESYQFWLSKDGVLQTFKSLTLPIRYWDELLKAIEKDKFERQTYSKTSELITTQYARKSGTTTDCILIRRTDTEVSVIFMKGTDMSMQGFSQYLNFLRNIGKL